MANFEAWNDLGSIARALYVQNHAIEEIESLKPPKRCRKISLEEAQKLRQRLRKFYNLFHYNQKDVDKFINPAYRLGQSALVNRITSKVTSYLTEYGEIINPDEPFKPLEYPEKLNLDHDLDDWIAYEDYLLLKNDIIEFNKLFSSVPQDILPVMKQFQKEGAIVYEVEYVVNKLRSNETFDTIIEAEIEIVRNLPPCGDDKDDFMAFVKKAIRGTRILRVFAVEDEESEEAAKMVRCIIERLPEIVRRKWCREVARQTDKVPVYTKLDKFIRIPVDVLFEEEKLGWGEWIGVIFGKILSKISETFRGIW